MGETPQSIVDEAAKRAALFAVSARERALLWLNQTNKGRALNRLAFLAAGLALGLWLGR